jgi:molybdate transport system ATP-binding protein
MAGAPGAAAMSAPVLSFAARLARPGFTLDAAFEAGPGVTALIGPSGSGKSTVLRLLAGLERPDAGRADLFGAPLFDMPTGLFAPPHRRRLGVVFQDALLFPHLTVASNLGYSRRFAARGAPGASLDAVVETLGIGHLLRRRPGALSGGERQRVALGRALLCAPRLLLMDEPLAALDAARRDEALTLIERMRDEFAIPILYVTHSAAEAARLAATAIRLENGRVVAIGPPDRMSSKGSILTGAPVRRLAAYDVCVFTHPAGTLLAFGALPSGQAPITLEANEIVLTREKPDCEGRRCVLAGRIAAVEPHGTHLRVVVNLTGGQPLVARPTQLEFDALNLREGEACWANAPPGRLLPETAKEAWEISTARKN